MKKNFVLPIVIAAAAALFAGGALTADKLITSKITSQVQAELPKSTGISASVPLSDLPSNLTSHKIRSADIKIEKFALKESKVKPSVVIALTNISKSKPTLIGSLDVTATIPASTIISSTDFEGARIVGNALQVPAGMGGLGQALLIPKYSSNNLYFELQSLTIFGNEIPASSLPVDIQSQVKNKSLRTLNVPKGLKIKSVSLSPKGLAVNLRGNNIQLGNLGSSF